MPNPDLWPSMIAEAKTYIRENLTAYSPPLQTAQVFDEMMRRRGFESFIASANTAAHGEDYTYAAGEVAWIVGEAIRQLTVGAEIRGVGGSTQPPAVRAMAQHLGFEGLGNEYRIESLLGALPRRVQYARLVEPGEIRWASVSKLTHEARLAHQEGFSVLAAVGARVATEEAVRRALEDVGVPEDLQPNRPWERENDLFDDHLTGTKGFGPMDRNSTRAVVSGTRDFGNTAAHTGAVEDEHLTELFVSILPRAMQSLSAAVDHATAEPT